MAVRPEKTASLDDFIFKTEWQRSSFNISVKNHKTTATYFMKVDTTTLKNMGSRASLNAAFKMLEVVFKSVDLNQELTTDLTLKVAYGDGRSHSSSTKNNSQFLTSSPVSAKSPLILKLIYVSPYEEETFVYELQPEHELQETDVLRNMVGQLQTDHALLQEKYEDQQDQIEELQTQLELLQEKLLSIPEAAIHVASAAAEIYAPNSSSNSSSHKDRHQAAHHHHQHHQHSGPPSIASPKSQQSPAGRQRQRSLSFDSRQNDWGTISENSTTYEEKPNSPVNVEGACESCSSKRRLQSIRICTGCWSILLNTNLSAKADKKTKKQAEFEKRMEARRNAVKSRLTFNNSERKEGEVGETGMRKTRSEGRRKTSQKGRTNSRTSSQKSRLRSVEKSWRG